LFDPLGITGEDWETDSAGINTGGWGLRLKTEDMAKFAELFLQKGKWNGRQILPASWVGEASTMKIMQDPSAPQSKKDSSDWLQGYCYQMWRCRHDAYRGDGAYGQFMIVMPAEDAVIAITAETADMQNEINLVWQYLLPAFKSKPLQPDPSSRTKLEAALKDLALPLSKGLENTVLPAHHNFSFASNDLHLTSAAFNFDKNICTVQFTTANGTFTIPFARSTWAKSETRFPGPSLTAALLEDNHVVYPAKIAASYRWKDASTLELALRYIESPHSEIFSCHFEGDKLSMDVTPSIGFGKTVIHADGTAN
ncbi:MAG TPA: hypothetical protein VGC95_00145, partial [Chitinophagaceae bacterium]